MTVERAEQAKRFLAKVLPAGQEGGLEATVPAANPVESILPEGPVPEHLRGPVERTAEKLARDEPLAPEDDFLLEAIIIPDKRPAVTIANGDYLVEHPSWTHFNQPAAKRTIGTAIRSIGRVELPGHPSAPFGGTGFVVGNGLLMTNRHVAEIFCGGLGRRNLVFRPGHAAGIDFKKEQAGGSLFLSVTGVAMIHPYWDMALLKVDGLPQDIAPLRLSTADPETLRDRDVAVIGYPAFDPRNNTAVQNQVFNGIYDVKRLMPGKLTGRGPIRSFGKEVPASMHDSSTLGGASGSAVVDVASGDVIALHFAGIYLKSNYGVATADLARDPRVVDTGINFAGGAAPGAGPWDQFWSQVEANEAVAAAPAGPAAGTVAVQAAAGGQSWTVPIEVTVTVGRPVPSGGGKSG